MLQTWDAQFERWTRSGTWAFRLHRLAHRLFVAGIPFIPCLIQRLNLLIHGCDIHYRASVGEGLQIAHPTGIVIGRSVQIGRRVKIYSGVVLGVRQTGVSAQPTIGDDVALYAGAKVVGAVSIGARAVVAANAVVTRDVPPDTVVGGIPARVIRNAPPQDQPAMEEAS